MKIKSLISIGALFMTYGVWSLTITANLVVIEIYTIDNLNCNNLKTDSARILCLQNDIANLKKLRQNLFEIR